MEKIKAKLDLIDSKNSSCSVVDADILKGYGLEDITLRQYQLDGVKWLAERYYRHHGCILADEMGLGKTCQTISFLLFLKGCGESCGPHLLISPLSVLGNWRNELKRFTPSFKVLVYVGNKDEREELQIKMRNKIYNVVLTTYELCLRDESFFHQYSWHTLVVDEAHRLKNRKSLLHQVLLELDVSHTVLLTGTPVQNNLTELYTLLSFAARGIFKEKYLDDFVLTFTKDDNNSNSSVISELHDLLRPFLLRRIKTEVMKDLPKKTEVILYHGMSALQKKYYKAILVKDSEAFDNPNKMTKTRLMNILVQLRKCVNHPYLFDGVEPEPFELGDHLINASGKLIILDQLLSYLQAKGHKVLIFSQMTRMLDIIQDYLGYRDFSYERLDGSVRGEERYIAVQNFNDDGDTFIFLLSTKAGGQGLNLVAADTVIFIDSDFNPQNDLQAAARAHRIGQTRAVRVIRLICQCTVEEIILKRALAKLRLTHEVIEGGQFSTSSDKTALIADDTFELQDILKFGVGKLFENEDSTVEDVDFEAMLGKSIDGQWQANDDIKQTQDSENGTSVSEDARTEMSPSNMYVFEGTDYSREPTATDRKAFDELLAAEVVLNEESMVPGPELRKYNTSLLGELPGTSTAKQRKTLTPEQREARKQKMAEARARRAREAEELAKKQAELKQKKKEQLWHKHGYISLQITLNDGDESDEEKEEAQAAVDLNQSDDEDDSGCSRDLGYLVGDVTKPQRTGGGKAIVVHCLDDSGSWGRGGLFTAISSISSQPEKQYELAGEMKDLHLGDVHLVPMDDANNDDHLIYCALAVVQHRNRKNILSGIKLTELSEALQKIYKAASDMKASVHLPRIGYNTPGFNWYGTERLIRKHLSSKGIPTYIYYYPRRRALKRKNRAQNSTDTDDVTSRNSKGKKRCSGSSSSGTDSRSRSPSPQPCSSKTSAMPSVPPLSQTSPAPRSGFMSGVCVHFHKVPQDVVDHYSGQLIAQGGSIDESASEKMSHVIVEADLPEDQQDELMAIVDEYRSKPIITLTWLSDCLKQARQLPCFDYQFG